MNKLSSVTYSVTMKHVLDGLQPNLTVQPDYCHLHKYPGLFTHNTLTCSYGAKFRHSARSSPFIVTEQTSIQYWNMCTYLYRMHMSFKAQISQKFALHAICFTVLEENFSLSVKRNRDNIYQPLAKFVRSCNATGKNNP